MLKGKITINIDNMWNNVLITKKHVESETNYTINHELPQLWPVIKGNCYGVGQDEIIRKLVQNGINHFFAFCIDEALQIRQQFKDKPELIKRINVLIGNRVGEEDLFVENNLTPVISSRPQLERWLNKAKEVNKKLDCIIQFNTGMNRNGFEMTNVQFIQDAIKQNEQYLNIVAILSHLGCASNPQSEMTKTQFKNWNILRKAFPNIKKTLPGSEGMFYEYGEGDEKGYQGITDYCRIGVVLYGSPVECCKKFGELKPVLNMVSYVNKDDNGYYINLGFKNFFSKTYCKNAVVKINGKDYKLKNISDDKMYIVAKNNEIEEGDEVLLVGESEQGKITTDDFCGYFESILQDVQKEITDNLSLYPDDFKKELIDTENNNQFVNNPYVGKHYLSHVLIKNNEPVEFTTELLEVREVSADGKIGYDQIQDVKVGDICGPIFNGYSDVFPRVLNGKHFKVPVINIDGEEVLCEIGGKISMDQTTILIPREQKDKIKMGCKCVIKCDKILDLINKSDFKILPDDDKQHLINEMKRKMLINKRCIKEIIK